LSKSDKNIQTEWEKEVKNTLQRFDKWKRIFSSVRDMMPPKMYVTNPTLQNVINSFAPTETINITPTDVKLLELAEFVETYSHKSKREIPEKYKPCLELGLVVSGTSSSQSKKEDNMFTSFEEDETIEGYVLLDVVEGILTRETMQNIRCAYQNANLIEMYKELKYANKYAKDIYRSPLLNINLMEKNALSKKAEKSKSQNTKQVPAKFLRKDTRKMRSGLLHGGFPSVRTVTQNSRPKSSHRRMNRKSRNYSTIAPLSR